MIELVDPRGVAPKAARSLARRMGSPDALRRIGFLSNEPEHMTGPHFPGYTRFLERALRERLGVTDFHLEIKPVPSRPPRDRDDRALQRFRWRDQRPG
jgi:hypothetical protein